MSRPADGQGQTENAPLARIGIPLVWQVGGSGVFILGGGKAGCQKARALARFGVTIQVMEPSPGPQLLGLALELAGLKIYPQAWTGSFPDGIIPGLAYACTDRPEVNADLGMACRNQGIPFCNAENPESGDFMSPACEIHGGFVLAVSSGGKKVKAAVAIRNRLKQAFHSAAADHQD